ncbi:hypothetical protein N7467_009017 [Penicillium canescens]|nr:hypothetical protein N7467_009017 [Penicillium canescens]
MFHGGQVGGWWHPRSEDLGKLSRFDLERDRGRGSLTLGGGVVIASTGMATVETPPYINNAVSTWNALQVQLARGSLITQMMNDSWYNWYRRAKGVPVEVVMGGVAAS